MTPFFADNSLMINLIEKENREMNLGIYVYRVIEIIFFTPICAFIIGWDQMEFWRVPDASLWISPQVNLTL